MPSRPLSAADRPAGRGRPPGAAGAARARRPGGRGADPDRPPPAKSWPPYPLVCGLAFRVKRLHLAEMRMRGPNGEVVDVIRYRDKMQQDRRCYRLSRHGVFIGEYETPEDLGKVVDFATLVEDDLGHAEAPPS